MSKLQIAHIVNPVFVDKTSDLYIAQPVTFETMKRAKKYAKKKINIELYATFYPEDEKIVPKWFDKTTFLDRAVLDIGTFNSKRKLPILKDILDRLYMKSNADYFVYTNVDIALMPHFYLKVRSFVKKGYDSFIINRRTLGKKYDSLTQIHYMYSDPGIKHPGHDCFVFKREHYKKFILGDACIGARKIARVLMSNMIAFSENYKVFENEHLTFHIGDDRVWNSTEFDDFYFHNIEELIKTTKKILDHPQIMNKGKLINFFKFNIRQIEETMHNYKNIAFLQEAVNDAILYLKKNKYNIASRI